MHLAAMLEHKGNAARQLVGSGIFDFPNGAQHPNYIIGSHLADR